MYLLDTDICSYFVKRRSPLLERRIVLAEPETIRISAVTHAEIFYGFERGQVGLRKRLTYAQLTRAFAVEPWPPEAAQIYGLLRADLERQGTPIGDHDIMIAAHAIANDLTLVTNNTRHFQRIGTRLRMENWAE